MARIESLTDEQKARFAEFIDRWTKIGLCTEPADRSRAEAAIRDMYRQGGLEPPKKIVWCGSPLSLVLTRAIVLDKAIVPDENVLTAAGASVEASIKASVAASIGNYWTGTRDRIEASVWDRVYDSFWVGAYVGRRVWDSVLSSVKASVRDGMYETVYESVRDSIYKGVYTATDSFRIQASLHDSIGNFGDSIYGGQVSHETADLAVYRYFFEVTNLISQTSKLSGLWELAQSAGWTLPHENICWVSERHNILARDERGRLHSLAGPACAYPDGWAIYAVHGMRVPAFVFEKPHEISVARIDAEENAEVRRVMVERYRYGEEESGAAAFMRDAGARRVDHDERYGTLWRRDVADSEPLVMVEVVNATPEPDGSFKRYWLRVHPELRPLLADNQRGPAQTPTVRNAVASTFGLLGEQYAPAIET